jgi:predicted O-methyltransferase YrrM
MGQIVPDTVERYLAGLNHLVDPVLQQVAEDGARQDLPLVDAEVGALLRVLAVAIGATRMLEIGTAIGYSGIWLAGALPKGGMLMTMELNPERAAVARENFAKAGLSDRVSVMVGDAGLLIAKVTGPFDLIFQDGSKRLYVTLLDRLVDRLRPGGLLVTDNVLWDGNVVPGFTATKINSAEDTAAVAEFNERVNTHPQLITATVPLRDGVSISVKRSDRS